MSKELDDYIRGWRDAGKGEKRASQSDEYYNGHAERIKTDKIMKEVGARK